MLGSLITLSSLGQVSSGVRVFNNISSHGQVSTGVRVFNDILE